MTRLSSALLLLLPSLALAGCAISPPPHTPSDRFCQFHMYRLEPAPFGRSGGQRRPVPDAGERDPIGAQRAMGAGGPAPDSAGAFRRQPARRVRRRLPRWLAALREGQRLPEFDVVTGISTGSILATFAFIGDAGGEWRATASATKRQLLTPIARSRPDGSMSPFELLRVVRRGAVADLRPLRDVLLEEINPAVMRQVAEARRQSRRLYVGAVDVDTGQAVAMDLTQMAWDYVNIALGGGAAETDAQRTLRTCYVDAIVASSSAPLAAVPVFIDNSMYVDGGVRFGMFADDVIAGAGRASKTNRRRTEFFVIANGDLETSVHCGRAERARCEDNPPSGRPTDPRSRWSLLNLAERSEQVLVNQVYRFSADRIIGQGKRDGNGVVRPDRPRRPRRAPVPDGRSGARYADADGRGAQLPRLVCGGRSAYHPIQFLSAVHALPDRLRPEAVSRASQWDIPSRRADPVAVPAPKP